MSNVLYSGIVDYVPDNDEPAGSGTTEGLPGRKSAGHKSIGATGDFASRESGESF